MKTDLTAPEIANIRKLYLAQANLQNASILSDGYIPAVDAMDEVLVSMSSSHPNFNVQSKGIDFERGWYGPDASDLPKGWKKPDVVRGDLSNYHRTLEDTLKLRETIDLHNPSINSLVKSDGLWYALHALFHFSPNFNLETEIVEEA